MNAPSIALLFVAVASACGRTTTDGAAEGTGGTGSAPFLGHVPSIHANGYKSCSLDAKGAVACWGDRTDSLYKPPEPAFRDLSIGSGQLCGIRADATMRCWGGEMGAPEPPPGKFRAVALSHLRGCVLDLGGHALCWGEDTLGTGVTKAPPGTFKTISGKSQHYCALREGDGRPVCWGWNEFGQASPPDEELTAISAGNSATCGLRPDGTAKCWGLALASIPAGPLRAVEVGGSHACFIHPDKHVSCSIIPTATTDDKGGIAAPPPGPFDEIALAKVHACGLRPDGSIACWGTDIFGAATPPK